jgi:glyoxylase I family protein
MPIGNRNDVIPGCGMHHIAVQTRDLEASLRLYRDVLGMPVVAQFGDEERPTVLLDIGDGSHMELFSPKPDGPGPGHPVENDPLVHVALATTDARAAAERVRAHGYEITVEPKDVDLGALDVTVAFFRGPSGEIVEFFQTH